MGRLWSWLASLFEQSPAPSKVPPKAHPDLHPLDVNEVARELRLKEEGARLGAVGVPGPDSTTPAGPEAVAIQRVEKVRQDYVDWARLRQQILHEDLAKLDITAQVNRAAQASEEFRRKASSVFAESYSLLTDLAAQRASAQAALRDFRSANRITRPAQIHSWPRAFLGYSLLVLLVVIEGIVNASFFAQGLDTGLVGGAQTAMMLAAANVVIAFCIGRFGVRNVMHVGAVRQVVGWLAVATALLAIGVIGLGISHFRDALTLGHDHPPTEALARLISDPFGLRDVFGRVPGRGVSPQPGQAEMHVTQRATAGSRVGTVSQSVCKPSSCM